MSDTRRHSGLRVRDSDRVEACALLDAAHAEGELTDAEYAQRSAAAMRARTFGDLDTLIGDLQIPRNLADAPVVRVQRRKPARRWQAAAATVVVAGLLGAMGGCASRTTAPDPPLLEPTTGVGLASFLATYRDRYGDLTADEMSLYPQYALVERAVDADRTVRLRYDEQGFSSTDTARDDDAAAFDLADLDVRGFAAVMAGAPETLRVPGGAISHIVIRRPPGANPADPGAKVNPPVVFVYAKDGSRGGYLELTLAGEVLAVHPAED
ncbi:Domain of uncharacterised function (DUF1707) [Nocardia otitidiscaviarum]|uniref:Domain of uncharacterized function (DUF1707) n=1 Tax=Nocardia otitidiscaviarum TaxID=1823 RepID=A0A378YAI1_9NOCA|nr:DUF1707 domain-containing protein [Nocardia otitidiscaviarum]SUA74084.1 Domain of uncharacterised function (DUF1707) [Nocardia otitidiscaviarum]